MPLSTGSRISEAAPAAASTSRAWIILSSEMRMNGRGMVSDRERQERRADTDSEERRRQREESSGEGHYPGHVGCSTFWCVVAFERDQDEPDPRVGGWFS